MDSQEADPQLLDALNDLRMELENLRASVSSLTQAVDELRGEIIERGIPKGS